MAPRRHGEHVGGRSRDGAGAAGQGAEPFGGARNPEQRGPAPCRVSGGTASTGGALQRDRTSASSFGDRSRQARLTAFAVVPVVYACVLAGRCGANVFEILHGSRGNASVD